jgi:hypothetical protein
VIILLAKTEALELKGARKLDKSDLVEALDVIADFLGLCGGN